MREGGREGGREEGRESHTPLVVENRQVAKKRAVTQHCMGSHSLSLRAVFPPTTTASAL